MLTFGAKFMGEDEPDAAPIGIIGGDVDARAFDEDGEGFDGFGRREERSVHSKAGLMKALGS